MLPSVQYQAFTYMSKLQAIDLRTLPLLLVLRVNTRPSLLVSHSCHPFPTLPFLHVFLHAFWFSITTPETKVAMTPLVAPLVPRATDTLVPIGHVDYTNTPIILIAVLLAITWTLVGLRTFTRGFLLRSCGWDDGFMIIALVRDRPLSESVISNSTCRYSSPSSK